MGIMTRVAALAALAMIGPALTASGAAARPPSPFLSAAEYLALRGNDGSAPCLSAVYRVTAAAGADERRFTSCPDYLAVKQGGVTQVFDFALERVLTIRPGATELISAHAFAASRRLEMQNRRALAARTGVVSPSAVFQEAELQAPWSGESFLALERRNDAAAEVFTYDGEEVARVRHGVAVPRALNAELKHAAYLFFGLHPNVADALAARGALPEIVASASGPAGAATTVFSYQSSRIEVAALPLSPSMALAPPAGALPARRESLGPALARTIARGPGTEASVGGLLSRLDARLAAGDAFGAYLASLEFMWTHEKEIRDCGRTFETENCKRFSRAIAAAIESDDPDVARYLKASEAETKGLFAEGLAALDDIDLAGRDDAHLVNVLRALLMIQKRDAGGATNDLRAAEDPVARAFADALAASPAMTSVLYDAGFDRARRFDTVGGWILFDAARAMPHFEGGLVDRIDAAERANRRILPYFFNQSETQQ